jgi:hypothetical protein
MLWGMPVEGGIGVNIRITAPGNVSRAADALEEALRELRPEYRVEITDPPFAAEEDEQGALSPVGAYDRLVIHVMRDDVHVTLPVSHTLLTDTDMNTTAAMIAAMIDRAQPSKGEAA